MRIVMFYHSLLSDWNHGNAHFLRGVATELISRGHHVAIFEPRDSWSAQNLVAEHGRAPIRRFHDAYPMLRSVRYRREDLDLDKALQDADAVLVHEWNEHSLVREIGIHRKKVGGYGLFFHDTHHRMVTDPKSMANYDLTHYDGVLAYGKVLQELYVCSGRVKRAWTWHEAADMRVFHPLPALERQGDLVWIGNWGDDERTTKLQEFFIQPAKTLGLKTRVYGVRYPDHARKALAEANVEYAGWLPNFEVPAAFKRYRVTVHVPRRPYVKALPGIPTIRPFEALACGIPLVCSPWEDAEGLFTPGRDFLVARNGREMTEHLRALVENDEMAHELADHGFRTIASRHTCAHRVNELLAMVNEVRGTRVPAAALPRNATSTAVLT